MVDKIGAGEAIGIFPEGGSHDRSDMLPLKAGVTLMALGALEKYPGLDLQIIPCGLNYFNAHKWRSKVRRDWVCALVTVLCAVSIACV